MAKDTNAAGPEQGKGSSPTPLEAARAARKLNATNRPKLSDRNRFALNLLRQAQRGCKLLSQRVQEGAVLDSATLQAASTLSGVAVSQLSD